MEKYFESKNKQNIKLVIEIGSRSSYFKLIMSTILLNIEMKKQLSIQYARLYPKMLTDFVYDDQEISASILSLSVQIFTVPSIVSVYFLLSS